jgi:hypothetical protein
MRFSIGLILFLALAALMFLNAMRSFRSLARSPADGSAPLMTGVVSLVAAGALVAAGFYMFWF